MNYYSTQITNLIEELRRLPGIGSKSAQRLAFHIINMPEEHVHHLAQTLVTAREKIRYCKYCCTLTDSEVCPICASTKRDHSTIMVVEHTQDLAAYEKTVSIMVFIMFFRERLLQVLEKARTISVLKN